MCIRCSSRVAARLAPVVAAAALAAGAACAPNAVRPSPAEGRAADAPAPDAPAPDAPAPDAPAPDAVLNGLRLPVAIAGRPAVRFPLAERMQSYAVPAVSIAAIRANRIAWSVAVGRRRADAPDGVSPHTIMQAASTSKPLVAIAVLRLVERHVLGLDDVANTRLRSWRIPDDEFTRREPVRIEHLLRHTASATNGAVGIYAPGTPVPTLLQALDGQAPSHRPAVRIDGIPGTTFRYAGGGYSILQQLLIDVTGRPFPELMRELVLDPTGMSGSCFCQPLPPSRAPNAAVGHDATGRPIAGDWWTLPEMAAGGLWSTADDLARFVVAVNRSWSGQPGAILTRASARRMLTPGLGGWGLGVAVDTVGGELRYLHTGANDGYRAELVGYPARGDGIVVLTNGDGGASLRDEIIRAAAAAYGWPGFAQTVRAEDAAANATLGDFAGRFQYAPRFATTFVASGDSLVASLNDGTPGRVFSERPDRFFSLAGTTYRFVRDGTGRVTTVVAEFADGSALRGRRTTP